MENVSNSSEKFVLPAFGEVETERVVGRDELFVAFRDKFPVSPGHTLIVPRRAVVRFQELTADESSRLMLWIQRVQKSIAETHRPAPDAFNLGVNDGKAAGQTMPQFHFHVIPRYSGDVQDPRGGLRWIIPGKAKYW